MKCGLFSHDDKPSFFVVTEGLLWKAKKVKRKAFRPEEREVVRGHRQEGAYGIRGGHESLCLWGSNGSIEC